MLVEGQRYTKDNLDKEAAKRLKHEQLPTPVVRESKICEMMQANDGPCGYITVNLQLFHSNE